MSKTRRTANPEMAAAFRELRQGSRTSRHSVKSRKGTRRSRNLAAIRDSRT